MTPLCVQWLRAGQLVLALVLAVLILCVLLIAILCLLLTLVLCLLILVLVLILVLILIVLISHEILLPCAAGRLQVVRNDTMVQFLCSNSMFKMLAIMREFGVRNGDCI